VNSHSPTSGCGSFRAGAETASAQIRKLLVKVRHLARTPSAFGPAKRAGASGTTRYIDRLVRVRIRLTLPPAAAERHPHLPGYR
jgi:hypothetical protein